VLGNYLFLKSFWFDVGVVGIGGNAGLASKSEWDVEG
jgi:hypothetical protein